MLKKIVFGLLFCSLLVELQYCSHEASQSLRISLEHEVSQYAIEVPVKSLRRRRGGSLVVKNIETAVFYPIIEDVQDQYNSNAQGFVQSQNLQEYDAAVVAYWMKSSVMIRVAMNTALFKLPQDRILYDLIKIDDALQKNKNSMKDELYQRQLNKVMKDFESDRFSRDFILDDMQANFMQVKKRLWIQHLQASIDQIHKNIEKTKIANSYVAWPYIKELHAVRQLSSVHTS